MRHKKNKINLLLASSEVRTHSVQLNYPVKALRKTEKHPSFLLNTTRCFTTSLPKPAVKQLENYSDRMHPTFLKGDLLAVRLIENYQQLLIWGEIYAVSVCDTVLVTRLYEGRDDQHLLSVPDNARYPAQELHKSWINDVSMIVGAFKMAAV